MERKKTAEVGRTVRNRGAGDGDGKLSMDRSTNTEPTQTIAPVPSVSTSTLFLPSKRTRPEPKPIAIKKLTAISRSKMAQPPPMVQITPWTRFIDWIRRGLRMRWTHRMLMTAKRDAHDRNAKEESRIEEKRIQSVQHHQGNVVKIRTLKKKLDQDEKKEEDQIRLLQDPDFDLVTPPPIHYEDSSETEPN